MLKKEKQLTPHLRHRIDYEKAPGKVSQRFAQLCLYEKATFGLPSVTGIEIPQDGERI